MTKRLFLDLGSHKGNDTAFYLDKGWKAVAVEAHPELAKEADARFHLQRFDCRVINRAITSEGKPAKLYASDKGHLGETHSILPHRVKRPEATPFHVDGTTLGYLLKAYGVPDYMKVDIEGADVLAIRQLHDWVRTGYAKSDPKRGTLRQIPSHLSVELCPSHPEEALEIFSHLAYMGYDRFEVVSQHWNVTVDIDTVAYPMSLPTAASYWFGFASAGVGRDEWYDLHALHSSAHNKEHSDGSP